MRRLKHFFHKFELTLVFAFGVLFIMMLTMALMLFGISVYTRFDFFTFSRPERLTFLTFVISALVIGTILATLYSHRPLRPIREVEKAADRIAGGDYSTRIHLKGPIEFQRLSESFNHMAEELSSVEMLRSDFVNNFSHEFKTPIVSISGFSRMLRRDDLSPEERNQYLDIIISESQRLADLSNNVLALTRYEQQTILSDRKRCNVSEQIRLAIAMLDSKWEDKEMDYDLIGDDIFVEGNEEMLYQVWINLIDNALKFSCRHDTLTIKMEEKDGMAFFQFSNPGEPLSPEAASHIFDKFYQADTSHAAKGNGLGLSIAKRILELHGGSIALKPDTVDEITFLVQLPISAGQPP